MKDGWQTKRLGECFRLKSGDCLTSKAMNVGAYPVFGGNGIAGMHNEFNLSGNNVIVGRVGALCGNARYVTEKIWLTDNAFKIVDYSVEFDGVFLTYLLNYKNLRRLARQAAQPVVSNSSLKDLVLRFPRLPEQKRIVGILDEAFEGIATAKANAEKNLQNARALFESHLHSVFTHHGDGWVEKRLETVSSILNGYAFKSTDFSAKEGVKCIKITNVGVREFVRNSDGYLPASFAREYDTVSVKGGSIVLALTRTIIAGGLKVAVVPNEYDGALLNQRVASIIANEKHLNGAFLFAYLSTQAIVDYVEERVNTLMQPNLSITDLRSMPIPVPPRREQDKITEQIDGLREETQRLECIYQQKLAALDKLKKSLLHQAFTGQL